MLSALQPYDKAIGLSNHIIAQPPTRPTPSDARLLRRYVDRIARFVQHGNLRPFAGSPADADTPRHRPRPAHIHGDLLREPLDLPAPLPWATPEPPANDADAQEALYLARPADDAALLAIQGQGVTLTIAGPRQSGKTMLLGRMIGAAVEQGKHVIALDLQLFDPRQLNDSERFFKAICNGTSCLMGIETRADDCWGDLGNSYQCTNYFEQIVLPQLDAPLVLAIDKVEAISDPALLADFAAMVRAWSSKRAASALWRTLDLVLLTSVEPDQLVRGEQSPFSSGETIVVDDFTAEQVAELNLRHGSPFTASQQQVLINLLGGHPYLLRWAFYLTAARHYTAAELINQAHQESGPFGDHLRAQL
ncbi:MAG TPA: AAA-like domain-containing protein, partial [Roseiflexaceae bacterium]|nr:AAA-like domain-containing protein [Roseiflexaceae bacterium]